MTTSWTTQRLGALYRVRDERAGALADSLPLMSVSQSLGVVPRSELAGDAGRAEELYSYKLCEPGDLVLNRMSAYKGALGIARERGLVSPDYLVMDLRCNVSGRFVAAWLKTSRGVSEMTLRLRGIGSVDSGQVRTPRLNESDLRLVPITLPSFEEQEVVADYLDRETARIDTLIKEQRSLIELLQERRTAVIDALFSGKARNTRLQHVCLDLVDCPHTTPDADSDGEYEAVRTASIRGGKYRTGNGIPVGRETWASRNAGGWPTLGDILFTREAPAGEACMVPHDRVCLGQRMVLLRIDKALCLGEFLLWQLYSTPVQDHFRLSMNGSTVGNVRLPVLRATPIWVPSLAEQRGIATELGHMTARIDSLMAEAQRFIELSQERRAALITAAVTGQIDVRGEAA